MKIVLDENLDHRLRLRLAGHEVFTMLFLGWVIARSSVEWRIFKVRLDRIIAAIERATPGPFQLVDCGSFNRRSDGR